MGQIKLERLVEAIVRGDLDEVHSLLIATNIDAQTTVSIYSRRSSVIYWLNIVRIELRPC